MSHPDVFVWPTVTPVTNDKGALTAEFLLTGDLQVIYLFANPMNGLTNPRTQAPYTLTEAFDATIADRQREIDDPDGFQPQKPENTRLIQMLQKEKEERT